MTDDPAAPAGWGIITTRPQLGAALRRVRKSRGLAQIDLADAAGVQRSTISAIENSQRSINVETLLRLFEVLEIEISVSDKPSTDEDFSEEEFLRRHTGAGRHA